MTKLVAKIRSYTHKNETQPFFTDLEIELQGDEIVCLLGESGIGKTRLLRILLGHADGVFTGEISYHINGITLSPEKARGQGFVGLFSEDAGLLPWLNVKENLAIPFALNPRLHPPSETTVDELFEQAKLDKSVLMKRPGQLSLGMLQRVRLIRTLAYSPKFLLLDETFTGLDPVTAFEIADMVATFVRAHQPCCLLVTHDLFNASRIASKIVLLDKNRNLVPISTPVSEEELLKNMKPDTKIKI